MNLIFLLTMLGVALLLFIIAFFIKMNEISMRKKCNAIVKGKVIKYTLLGNEGVYFPIVLYEVDGVLYRNRLKYGAVISKSSSLYDIESKIENNVLDNNIVVRKNSHISSNVLEKYFPIGKEVDVYYYPLNPKKSYVIRLAKSVIPKIYLILGFVLIVVGFLGSFVIK